MGSCHFLSFILSLVLLISSYNEVANARNLLESTLPEPAIPSLPIPELPTLPEIPKPELPTIPEIPKPELPQLPVPPLLKPELPAVPKVELPKVPEIPNLHPATTP
ncbi:hypothetical protein HN51_037124 [Arachis hypogaea]|nr:uncharacterized protein DS421_13g425540 [Arachis hypogaea]